MSPVTYFLQLGPSFQNSTASDEISFQHMNLWGTFLIQTLTVGMTVDLPQMFYHFPQVFSLKK
jgi:hypothetical protein